MISTTSEFMNISMVMICKRGLIQGESLFNLFLNVNIWLAKCFFHLPIILPGNSKRWLAHQDSVLKKNKWNDFKAISFYLIRPNNWFLTKIVEVQFIAKSVNDVWSINKPKVGESMMEPEIASDS